MKSLMQRNSAGNQKDRKSVINNGGDGVLLGAEKERLSEEKKEELRCIWYAVLNGDIKVLNNSRIQRISKDD